MYRQFKDFLIKQGVLEQYTRNLREQRKPGETWFSDRDRIVSAFDWHETALGYSWLSIHKLWMIEYNRFNG